MNTKEPKTEKCKFCGMRFKPPSFLTPEERKACFSCRHFARRLKIFVQVYSDENTYYGMKAPSKTSREFWRKEINDLTDR